MSMKPERYAFTVGGKEIGTEKTTEKAAATAIQWRRRFYKGDVTVPITITDTQTGERIMRQGKIKPEASNAKTSRPAGS